MACLQRRRAPAAAALAVQAALLLVPHRLARHVGASPVSNEGAAAKLRWPPEAGPGLDPSAERRLFDLPDFLGDGDDDDDGGGTTPTSTTRTATATVLVAAQGSTPPQVVLPSMLNPVVFPSSPPNSTASPPPGAAVGAAPQGVASASTTTMAAGVGQRQTTVAYAAGARAESTTQLGRSSKVEQPPTSEWIAGTTVTGTTTVTATGSTTVAQVAVCSMRVMNISYLGLISNISLLYSFEERIKMAIAAEVAGDIVPEDIALVLSAGSVIAQATIQPQGNTTAREVQSRLNASVMLPTLVRSSLLQLSGLVSVAYGDISVVDWKAPLPRGAAISGAGAQASQTTSRRALDINIPSVLIWALPMVALVLLICGGLIHWLCHRHHGGKRGTSLEGHELLQVSSETPRTFRSSGTPRTAHASSSEDSGDGYSESGSYSDDAEEVAEREVFIKPGVNKPAERERQDTADQTLRSQAAQWGIGKPPAPMAPVSYTGGAELDLVTVTDGGLHVQQLQGYTPPPGVPVVLLS